MSNILHSQGSPGGEARADVLAHVAGNIRRLRLALEMSQAALADASGLSRRMIVGVESGEANISLSNLDRIAEALGARFSELIRAPDAPDGRRIESLAWRGAHPESEAVLLGTAPAEREVELWRWSLGPGEVYPAEADSGNWHEMLAVTEGVLVVEASDGRHEVKAGDFLIFSSAQPYRFVNEGQGVVRFLRNVAL